MRSRGPASNAPSSKHPCVGATDAASHGSMRGRGRRLWPKSLHASASMQRSMLESICLHLDMLLHNAKTRNKVHAMSQLRGLVPLTKAQATSQSTYRVHSTG
eukprot:813884-Rhodomonas_salina.1